MNTSSPENDIEKDGGVDGLYSVSPPDTTEIGKSSKYSTSASTFLPAKLARLVGKSKGAQATVDLVSGEEEDQSWNARFRRVFQNKHVEQRGVQRVPEDERTATSYFNIGSVVCLMLDELFVAFYPECLTDYYSG